MLCRTVCYLDLSTTAPGRQCSRACVMVMDFRLAVIWRHTTLTLRLLTNGREDLNNRALRSELGSRRRTRI
jgi:hypothetical protein